MQATLEKSAYKYAFVQLKKKLRDLFGSVLPGGQAKNAAGATVSLAKVLPRLFEARKQCLAIVSQSAEIQCEQQVLLSIKALSSAAKSDDPLIRRWQSAMFAAISAQNKNVLRQLESGFAPEEPQEESGGSLGR